MAKVEERFVDPKHSEFYSIYRPQAPPQIINIILDFIKQKLQPPFNQAVDVGCGSGQSTSVLSSHFKCMLGTDISESQIDQARKRNTSSNVQYQVGPCDSVPFPNESAELFSAFEAVHWFNLPSFFKEVDRVLVPGGVVALVGYIFPESHGRPYSDEVNKLLLDMYHVTLDGYWDPKLKLLFDDYRDIELPYPEQSRDTLVTPDANWSIANYIGLIRSWSGYQLCVEKEPEKAKEAILVFQRSMSKAVGECVPLEEAVISIRWKYVLIMSRKPMSD